MRNILGFICPLCHEQTEGNGFCLCCSQNFYHQVQVCPVCAQFIPNAQLCGACQKNKLFYDALFVSVELDDILLNVIHSYKYQKNMQLSGALSELMLSQTPHFSLDQIDWVVSVPISRQHLWIRGFNQSQLLAKAVAKRYHKRLLPEKNFHRKDRPHQAGLKYKQRLDNIKNVFDYVGTQDLSGKTILIVDDIATTGATINELARCLKLNKASRVYAWALAKKTHK